MLFIEFYKGSAPAAAIACQPVGFNVAVAVEQGVNRPPYAARPFAVNNAKLGYIFFEARINILGNEAAKLIGPEGMQV